MLRRAEAERVLEEHSGCQKQTSQSMEEGLFVWGEGEGERKLSQREEETRLDGRERKERREKEREESEEECEACTRC